MKKTLALLMALALLISAVAIPAMAEETNGTVDQVTSATTSQNNRNNHNAQNGRGGHGGRQQVPGQSSQTPDQNSQVPQLPDQNTQAPGQNSQVPQVPDQNTQDSQASESTQSSQTDGSTQDSQAAQQSQLPGKNGRGTKHGNRSGIQDSNSAAAADKLIRLADIEQLLKALLDSGVITQDQYNLIITKINAVQGVSQT